MVHISSLFRLLGFIVLLGGAFSVQAQRPPQSVLYDSLGRTLRMNHEIIVGFAPSAINRAAVSSRTGDEGPLSNFLKPTVGSALQATLGIRLSDIYAIKGVSFSIPADSLNIDNTGQTIANYPFWSTLLLILPAEADDYTILNALRSSGFTVVQFAHCNWTNFLLSSSTNSTATTPAFLLSDRNAAPLAYPVPTHDVLNFSFPQPLPASAEITILTVTGQVIRTEKHAVYQHGELLPLQLNVASLPSGRYFYRLTTPNNYSQGRFEKLD